MRRNRLLWWRGESFAEDVTDRDRFEAEALVWLDAVHRAAYALCGQAAAADDLVQTTFLKAWQSFSGFAPGTNCRAWLLRILRNTWLDQVRKMQPGQLDPDSLGLLRADDRPDTPCGVEEIQRHLERFADEQVVAALMALPEEFRLALFLVDVEGYTHEEAAGIMSVAVGTVKSRTSRARELVRRQLAAASTGLGLKVVRANET